MQIRSAKNKRGFSHVFILLAIVVIAVVGFACWKVYKNNKPLPTLSSSGSSVSYNQAESKTQTGGNCSGAGSVTIGPPMPLSQVSFILPYGAVVGGHVTPIDHQYYNGLDVHATRDTYEVIAPAAGQIVSIEHRGTKTNTPAGSVDIPSSDEYRIVMAHTCSFLTYVDLVTSLSPAVKSHLPANWDPLKGFSGSIPITKGEVIGHIGGQTLDFAVWDLSKPLPGFISYADYTAENWKPYTAPPTAYMDAATKAAVIAKYVRTAAPVDGKIDYDKDGKLIGNWFQVGTGGYHAPSNKAQDYWNGHLSIAPDNIDPSIYNASIGNYGAYPGAVITTGDAGANTDNSAQFMLVSATPDPATVGVSTGLVKYQLAIRSYILPSGLRWDQAEFAAGVKAVAQGPAQATVLAQLTGTRTLKFEAFPGKTPAQVTGFDSHVTTYTR